MSVWDNLVGQEQAVAQLRAIANGDSRALAQSWLICGPPGSGRSNVARAFAAALEDPAHGEGEELSKTAKMVLDGTHPDVTVLTTNKVTIGIDDVRELVAQSEQMPSLAPWRIIIIEDVDRMLERTTNVLLKEIEEPSSRTIWLLCAPSAQDVLPTIRSRTRLVNLAIPDTREVASYLESRFGVDEHLAARAARLSEGHIGVAKLYAGVGNSIGGEAVTRGGDAAGGAHVKSAGGRGAKGARAGSSTVAAPDDRALADRDELIVGVLDLHYASQAVLLAAQLMDNAKGQAEEDAEQQVAREEAEFRRVNGLEPEDKIPTKLRGAFNAIGKKDEIKRRITRRQRDVLDRSLNSVASVYRDVSVLQNDAEDAVGLVNLENRKGLTDLSVALTREEAIARMEAISVAKRRLAGNGNPQLVLEALFCELIPPLR